MSPSLFVLNSLMLVFSPRALALSPFSCSVAISSFWFLKAAGGFSFAGVDCFPPSLPISSALGELSLDPPIPVSPPSTTVTLATFIPFINPLTFTCRLALPYTTSTPLTTFRIGANTSSPSPASHKALINFISKATGTSVTNTAATSVFNPWENSVFVPAAACIFDAVFVAGYGGDAGETEGCDTAVEGGEEVGVAVGGFFDGGEEGEELVGQVWVCGFLCDDAGFEDEEGSEEVEWGAGAGDEFVDEGAGYVLETGW
ncbi:hypothetical protein BDD12DRAFT_57863 [Trichophaea hybrida]|nr:hypothetical protein BDD12DRAFT_57863 [Trichophaea hybrida]